MILEKYPQVGSLQYATLLIADYHLEYPLEGPDGARIELLWHPFQLAETATRLGVEGESDVFVEEITRKMFPNLEAEYNGHYDQSMNLWHVQGKPGELLAVFNDLAQALMGGPVGADDDTYDYWPGAFDMLITMAEDLITLEAAAGSDWISNQVRRVVWSAIAVQGPPEKWEAEGIVGAANNIANLEAGRHG
jgi:hypothetical protein